MGIVTEAALKKALNPLIVAVSKKTDLVLLLSSGDVLRPAGQGLHPRPTSRAASAPQMGTWE